MHLLFLLRDIKKQQDIGNMGMERVVAFHLILP